MRPPLDPNSDTKLLNIKISEALRDKIKQKSKEVKIPVSAVLRASINEILQKDEEEIRELVERSA